MSPTSGLSLIKVLLLCIGAGLAVLAGGIAYSLGPKLYYMKSEYVTANAISATEHFVSAHPGEWPHSWKDIGEQDLSAYTDMRFDLTVPAILNDKELIYSAIQPKCHRYRTYPHAKAQLDQLFEKIASVQAQK